MEARSCSHYCTGKAISITHSQCLFVALVMQHAMLMRHILICWLSGSAILHWNYYTFSVCVCSLSNATCNAHAPYSHLWAFWVWILHWNYYTFSVSVCSLSYPACNAHAPYSHLWAFWLYHIALEKQ